MHPTRIQNITCASEVRLPQRCCVGFCRKLLKEQAAVTAELEKVFGSGLDIGVEEGSGNKRDSDQAAVIALGVILAVCVVALVVLVTVYVVK